MGRGKKIFLSLLLTVLFCITNVLNAIPIEVKAATTCAHNPMHQLDINRIDAHTTIYTSVVTCSKCGVLLSHDIQTTTTPHDWYVSYSYVENGVTHFVIVCRICGLTERR